MWERAGLHSIRPEGRDSRSEFEKQFAGGQIAIGLEEDGQLIGVVIVTNDTRKGWINRLAIDPAYRRKGYGEQLVHAAEDALHESKRQLATLLNNLPGVAYRCDARPPWRMAKPAPIRKTMTAAHSSILIESTP